MLDDGYWEALHPTSAGGAYVNFIMDEGQERVSATYRDNYDRLVEVKDRYDPDQSSSYQPEHPARRRDRLVVRGGGDRWTGAARATGCCATPSGRQLTLALPGLADDVLVAAVHIVRYPPDVDSREAASDAHANRRRPAGSDVLAPLRR